MSICTLPPAVYPHEGVSVSDEESKEQQRRLEQRIRTERQYRMQITAAGLLRHRRALQGCRRWVAYGKDGVELLHFPKYQKGRVKGLQSCSSPHVCPVCAPKIAERRVRLDLTPGLARARELGHGILVLASTLRHQAKDDFDANMAGLMLARETARSGGRWTRLRKRYGILGTIRAFECTYGLAGFHPHFHELMIFEQPLSVKQQMEFEGEMKGIWQDSIDKAGLSAVTLQHGLHISDSHKEIEEYIQKQLRAGTPEKDVKRPHWDLPQEMAKQPVKKGRSVDGVKGYSMFELLAVVTDFAATGEKVEGEIDPYHAADVFREFDSVVTARRVRQLYWSPGLKARLGVKDLSDEQIEALEEQEKDAVLFDTLETAEIQALNADEKRAELQSALDGGDFEEVQRIIAPYKRALATEKYDPEWEEVYAVPAFDQNRPVIASPRLVLTKATSDERDFVPTLANPRYVECLATARFKRESAASLAEDNHNAVLKRSKRPESYRASYDRARRRRKELAWLSSSWNVCRKDFRLAVLYRVLWMVAVGRMNDVS